LAMGCEMQRIPMDIRMVKVADNTAPLLTVRNLKTYFPQDEGTVKAVDGVSFDLYSGRTLGIVGESGCGKSITARSILRIVDRPGRIVEGQILFRRQKDVPVADTSAMVDLAQLEPYGDDMRAIRGAEIALIFQEPMSSFSPVHTIGNQIMEAILFHRRVSNQEARDRGVELLKRVGIPRAEQRMDEYAYQLSGGLRQRAMIAMALSCNPKVLIADEPTTALDVTIQAQILDLVLGLQDQLGTAILLITHDLGVVAETAQRVIVMYAGRKVEEAEVDALFAEPLHPYTHGLLGSIPRLGLLSGRASDEPERLREIPGMVPALTDLPPGCRFAPRCAYADALSRAEYPPYEEKRPGHWAACWHSDRLYGERNG
jgi:peptide/nickel transport system ATP-binding protein